MCLRINSRVNVKFINGKATVYKLFSQNNGLLVSPFQYTKCVLGAIYKSDRPNTILNEFEYCSNLIDKGVHVFTSLEEAQYFIKIKHHYQLPYGSDLVIVRCEVLELNLVAVGYFYCFKSAVFTEVIPLEVICA